jgi:hypothetical protein
MILQLLIIIIIGVTSMDSRVNDDGASLTVTPHYGQIGMVSAQLVDSPEEAALLVRETRLEAPAGTTFGGKEVIGYEGRLYRVHSDSLAQWRVAVPEVRFLMPEVVVDSTAEAR